MAEYGRVEGLVEFAKTLTPEQEKDAGVTRSYLRLVGYGHKRPSAKAATGIERISEGQFKREQLRADWKEIWPELVDMKRTVK